MSDANLEYLKAFAGASNEVLRYANAETGRRLKQAHAHYNEDPERWHGVEWYDWCEREFGLTPRQVRVLEELADE